ncbi:MAG TPA: type II toxin-antitoxin system HicA family toxin [Gemmataceae bacterium]|nr:type II toxin-antitoxin system HicA family toxin [Gemmataceae bacterium]
MAGRRLRGVRPRQAIQAFVRAGGVRRKKGRGDHVNIKMPTGVIVTIPNRGTLKVGLLKAAIAKAGLTEDQFLDLL